MHAVAGDSGRRATPVGGEGPGAVSALVAGGYVVWDASWEVRAGEGGREEAGEEKYAIVRGLRKPAGRTAQGQALPATVVG